jgi:hypothetical protein
MTKTSLYFISGIDFLAGVLMLTFRNVGRSWGDTGGYGLAGYGIYCVLISYGIALGAMRGQVPYGTFLARVFLCVFGFIFLFIVKVSTWSNRGNIEMEGNWLLYFVAILIYCFGGIFSVVLLYINFKGGRTKKKMAAMNQLSAAEQGLDGQMPGSGMMPPGSGMMAPMAGMMDPMSGVQPVFAQPGGFVSAVEQPHLLAPGAINPQFAYPTG